MEPLQHRRSGLLVPGLILAALLALPAFWLLRMPVYPFTDLPNHLAAATIYRHLDDPQTKFSAYFAADISALKPNIAHILFCAAFPSVETGNRVWLAGMLLILGASMVFLFREAGANPSMLPLSVLLVFNANLWWGFIGFAFAVPLLVALAALVILYLRDSSPWWGAAVALLLCLLFYAHVFALMFGILFVAMSALLGGTGSLRRRCALALLPLLPAGVLMGGWILHGQEFRDYPTAAYLVDYYRWHYPGSLIPRAGRLLTNDNAALASTQAALPWTGIFSLILIGGIASLVHKRRLTEFWERGSSRVLLALLLSATVCFMCLPNALPGVVPVYSRFTVLVTAGAFLVTAVGLRHIVGKITLAVSTIVALVYLGVWHGYLTDFERTTGSFTHEFLARAGGSSVELAAIIRDPEFRGSRPLVHFNNYHTIWNLGITPTKMAEYKFGAIRFKPGGKPLPEYQEWVSPDARIDELLHRYSGMGSVLYHSVEGGLDPSIGVGLTEIAHSGEWILYQRSGER